MYSGKTAACQILESLGAYLLYSDKITHNILDHNKTCQAELRNLFGEEIFKKGKCVRSKLADIVFANRAHLESLEKIIHPLLLDEINQEYERVKHQLSLQGFYVELPLVQELDWNKHFDKVIAITTDEQIIFKRLTEQRGEANALEAKQEYKRRMKRQWSPEEKGAKADITLTNNGSKEELKAALVKQLNL